MKAADNISESSDLTKLYDRIRSALEGLDQSAFPWPAVRALVEVDPRGALRWLADAGPSADQDQRELGAVVSSAFAALGGVEGADEEIASVVERYSDRLGSPEILRGARALTLVGRGDAGQKILESALARMPSDPGLLRELANAAVREDASDAHALLSRLARAESGAANAMRVYRSRSKISQPDLQPLRVAVLSSYTIDSVLPHLDLELRDLDLVPELYLAPFDTWEREVLDPGAALRSFDPELAFLAVSIDDLAPELAGGVDAERLASIGEIALERVLGAATQFAGWSGAPLVVHSFHSVYAGPLGILEGRSGPSRSRWVADLNAQLAERLSKMPRAYMLDMDGLLSRREGGPLDQPKMRHMGGMRLSEGGSVEVARAYARYAAPLTGRTRKVVVLDLDNTLWGGVVGEDGPNGIKLNDHGPGAEFQEFQKYLLSLSEQGVLLAINSKNNAEDAWEVIRNHEGMILREEHFSAARINWQPKPENLMEIAAELDLGVDSLIFVDDNPNERERVRQFLPQVLVPELPNDSTLYRQTVEALPQLQRLETTTEDLKRVSLYREKRERENARASVGSVAEYLETLAIELELEFVNDTTQARVHQLFQRTNQFNTTTRRYDIADLEAISKDKTTKIYTLRAKDRFGDHGLVAVALVRIQNGGAVWCIDSFLMSCRVIGYGIETALLAVVSEAASAAAASRLRGEYIPTAKNPPVADLFATHGFGQAGSEGDLMIFEKNLADNPISRPEWLRMEVQDET